MSTQALQILIAWQAAADDRTFCIEGALYHPDCIRLTLCSRKGGEAWNKLIPKNSVLNSPNDVMLEAARLGIFHLDTLEGATT